MSLGQGMPYLWNVFSVLKRLTFVIYSLQLVARPWDCQSGSAFSSRLDDRVLCEEYPAPCGRSLVICWVRLYGVSMSLLRLILAARATGVPVLLLPSGLPLSVTPLAARYTRCGRVTGVHCSVRYGDSNMILLCVLGA